jgi:hypothetical protein
VPGTERHRHPVLSTLDAFLFGFAALSAVWLAYLLLRESLHANWQVLLVAVFWLLVAYLVLPRVHRILTRVYVPAYFIGRARTSDGLLGDPVNVALLGEAPQLHAAMTRAAWTRADDVTLASSLRIVATTVSRQSYPEAPVSPLTLFGRVQDFAYQQEVDGNPAQRHHVRFWRCPEGWRLPGGHEADWVAAGSYDNAVGLSLMTFQVTHRISGDIDAERDHLVSTVTAANPDVGVEQIRHFSTGYHARNGGGDRIETDGDLPVVDLRRVPASPQDAPALDTGDRRPAPLVFGAGVAIVRGLYSLLVLGLLVLDPGRATSLVPNLDADGTPVAVAALGVVFVVDVGLGLATLHGRDWARVVLMLSCVGTIVGAFVAEASGGSRPTLGAGLPVVALGILVLFALTSHRARDYASRPAVRSSGSAGPAAGPTAGPSPRAVARPGRPGGRGRPSRDRSAPTGSSR